MKPKHVKVFSPATIANLGAGFDVLGLAIDGLGDIVTAKRIAACELQFSLKKEKKILLPTGNNVAQHVAQLMLDELELPFGIALTLHKNMPIGSGLGSSGASSAAAVFAVNALLPKPLAKMDLLRFAVEGERLASGAPHADNVAPSLLGGLCLIRDYHPLSVLKIPVKNVFHFVVAHPHFILETQRARGVLPETLPLNLAVSQLGCLGGLITGLITGDKQLTGDSMRDHIAEPSRAELIPGYYAARQVAMDNGALAFSISGSGPSVFALAASPTAAKRIGIALKRTFYVQEKINCDIYISKINHQGSKIIG